MRVRTLTGTCFNIETGKVIVVPLDPAPANTTLGMLVPNEPIEYPISSGVITSGDIIAPAKYRFKIFDDNGRVFEFIASVPEDPDGPTVIRFEDIYTSQGAAVQVGQYPVLRADSLLLLTPGGGTSSQFLGQTAGELAWKSFSGTHAHPITEVDGLQGALDGKSATGHGHAITDVSGLQSALDLKATIVALADEIAARIAADSSLSTAIAGKLSLSGGALLGMLTLLADPTLPLHAATKQYVDSAFTALVNSAPSTLDTLDELAAALGDDPNFATTMTTSLGTKCSKSANLSDLTDVAAARANLLLGAAALLAVGMTAGTVAAGDDVRFLSTGQKTDLTDGGESTLHYHASDRDRSNHTGTQLAATISDLGSAVMPASGTLTDGPTITWAWSFAAQTKEVTLGGNRTLSITGLAGCAEGLLKVKQDATGSRTLSIALTSPVTAVKVVNAGGGALTLSSAANAEDLVSFALFGTTLYVTVARGYT